MPETQPKTAGKLALGRMMGVFGAISLATTVILIAVAGGPGELLDAMGTLDPSYLLLVGLVVLVEWTTDALRFYTTALALGVRLPPRLAVQVTFADLFFSYLTPGAGFGAPLVTYMLYRRGVPLPRALAIALLKPLLTLFVLVPGLTLLTAAGGDGFVAAPALQVLVAGLGGLAWAGVIVLIAVSVWPRLASRIIDAPLLWLAERRFIKSRFAVGLANVRDGAHNTIHAFGSFVRRGWVHPASSLLAVAVNVVAFCGIAVVLLMGFGASCDQLQLWGLSLLNVAVISVSPTPGASGFAEGGGMAIFQTVLATDEQAAAFVLVWRALTCYLPLVIGAIVFARFIGATPIDRLRELGTLPTSTVSNPTEQQSALDSR